MAQAVVFHCNTGLMSKVVTIVPDAFWKWDNCFSDWPPFCWSHPRLKRDICELVGVRSQNPVSQIGVFSFSVLWFIRIIEPTKISNSAEMWQARALRGSWCPSMYQSTSVNENQHSHVTTPARSSQASLSLQISPIICYFGVAQLDLDALEAIELGHSSWYMLQVYLFLNKFVCL